MLEKSVAGTQISPGKVAVIGGVLYHHQEHDNEFVICGKKYSNFVC